MQPVLSPNHRHRIAILRQTVARLEHALPGAPPVPLPFGLPEIDRHLPGSGLACGALHEVIASAHGDKAEAFRAAYAEWGHWIILIKGVTPIPYKIVTITSGFAGYNLLWFTLLSIVTRGARFFLVAGLLYLWGPPAREFIERRLELVAVVSLVVIVAGFYVATRVF